MAEESAEDRLAAALERIARVVDSGVGAVEAGGVPASEVAARLDRVIATLRQALGGSSDA